MEDKEKIELIKQLIDEIPTCVIGSFSNEEYISSEDIGWDEENEQLNIYTNLE